MVYGAKFYQVLPTIPSVQQPQCNEVIQKSQVILKHVDYIYKMILRMQYIISGVEW